MKDELGGKIMKEFIGLRPKMYSYVIHKDSHKDSHEGNEEHKKCKGIKNA